MPLLTDIIASNTSTIQIWDCTESLDWAYQQISVPTETQKSWQQFHEKRQKELVFAVILFNTVFPDQQLAYYPTGKPYIVDSKTYISISHSGNLVVIAKSSYAVGIDLEFQAEKCARIYHKFIHSGEQLYIKKENLPLTLAAWCAKESIYKAVGQDGLKFKEQILLPTFARSGGRYGLAMLKKETQSYKLFVGKINSITWVLAELNQVDESIGISEN